MGRERRQLGQRQLGSNCTPAEFWPVKISFLSKNFFLQTAKFAAKKFSDSQKFMEDNAIAPPSVV